MKVTMSAPTTHPPLFDDLDRTDPSPAGYEEHSFSFMNRVNQPFWDRVRDELDRWFAGYPSEHAADLRGRFRDGSPAQHFGAWWELYLHRLLTCLEFEVEVHPDLPVTEAKPDFRITRDEKSVLIEAATTFSGIVDEERDGVREAWIKAAADEASNPNFFVGLEFERVGAQRPSVREIVNPLERWLDQLDPDEVSKEGLVDAPTLRLPVRDWELVFTAIPVKPEARGRPDHRMLGMGPSMGGMVNDVDMLMRTLERKRSKYGRPDEPFMLAVLLMSAFMENEDIEQALLGRMAWEIDVDDPTGGRWIRQRNGFWLRGAQPRGTRVSGVLTGTNIMPWTVAKTWLRLWPNPWATSPLHVEFGFPRGVANTRGRVSYEDVPGLPGAVLGLSPDWPGPERPFEGN